MKKEEGFCINETCNRDGCKGIIEERDIDGGCSCHINPPCGYCTEPKNYCPECGWDEKEESEISHYDSKKYWDDYHKRPDVIEAKRKADEEEKLFYSMYQGETPVEKYMARHRNHTHFSQIIFGVHPNMDKSEIREKVKGTFGGRFSKFDEYSFEYIAYTD